MAGRYIIILCYWDGTITQSSEGLSYDKPPKKAIKVELGTKYMQLLDKMYFITSLNREQFRLKITCRYPSVVGQMLKYIPIPIKDDDDVDIMFNALAMHSELSNIDLYLEVELTCIEDQTPMMGSGPFTRLLTQGSYQRSSQAANNSTFPCRSEINANGEGGRGIDWNAVPQMVDTEGYTCVLQNTNVNNDLMDVEDVEDVNEEMGLDDMLEGEESDHEIREELTPNFQPESEHGLRHIPPGKTLHEPPSVNFTNVDALDNAGASNWSILPHGCRYDPTQELCKGAIFNTKEEVIRAVKLYCIRRHQQYEVVESCPTIWRLRCKRHLEFGCQWKLRACKRSTHGQFEITQYTGPHTCLYPKLSRDHPHINADLIAHEVLHLVKEQPSITVSALRAEIIEKLSFTVSYKKVWKGKQKAIEQIFGDWDTSYTVLPKFMAALQFYNQGTIVEWCTESSATPNEVEFRRVFWAFSPSIEGFKHCRPVMSIDGTHLYGKYHGTMMIAMGIDGNNQLLPLAFAIVEGENYNSWRWFLYYVKKHVVQQREGICLISDRHSGIIKAVNDHGSPWKEPYGFHRYCPRHFLANFQKKFHDSHLKALAYKAGSQNQLRKFNAIMEEIGGINPKAREWLEKHCLCKWSLAHDGGKRYGIMTTNLSEVFNSVLKGARYLPITACVQLTFYRLVHYFDARRAMGVSAQNKGEVYTPHVVAKQTALMLKANAHTLKSFNRNKGLFEVVTQMGKNVQIVSLDKGTCTCGKWQIDKYPCSHVLGVCRELSLNSWVHIERFYSIEEYLQTWAPQFHPLPHEAYWPESDINMVPDYSLKRSKKGRPQSTRLRNEMDVKEGRTLTRCGICRDQGHDRRKCPTRPPKVPANISH